MKLRQILAGHTAPARRIEQVEATQKDHAAILSLVAEDVGSLSKKAAREFKKLKAAPRRRTPQIGFRPPAENYPVALKTSRRRQRPPALPN